MRSGVAKCVAGVSIRRMSQPPLEDNFNDILGKTRRGLHRTDAQIAATAGISAESWARLLDGDASDESALRAAARALGLGAEALVALARGEAYPVAGDIGAGFAMFSTPFGEGTVNSYLVWDPATREAAAFDTGTSAEPMLAFIREHGLKVTQIFITHTHADHIQDLARLVAETGAVVRTEPREPVSSPFVPFTEGDSFPVGSLRVRTLLTCGHSPGQTTLVVEGLAAPLAIVGDSLFAGSMGGSADRFEEQRDHTAKKILGLAPDTRLASGHGPVTTVATERVRNPFFAL